MGFEGWKSTRKGSNADKLVRKVLHDQLTGTVVLFLTAAGLRFFAAGRRSLFFPIRSRRLVNDQANAQQNQDAKEKDPVFLLHGDGFGLGRK